MRLPTRPAFRGRAGFSLVELLIVIAIVAILGGLLFPVFAQAREKARQAACASNQRQLGMAFMQYAQDHDEVLPPYSLGPGFHGGGGYGGADGPRWADLVQPYLKSRGVLDCPSAEQRMRVLPGAAYFDVESYSYGITTPTLDLMPDALFGAGGQPLSRIEDPSSTLMLADDTGPSEHCAEIEPDPLDVPAILSFKVDGLRHTTAAATDYRRQAFNALYVDGHVRFVRLTDTTANALRQWRIR